MESVLRPAGHRRHPVHRAGAVKNFIKKNVVLIVAATAAAATMFFVPPDAAYFGYFDFKTLTCLFCVLAVVCALKNIDFETRQEKPVLTSMEIVRIGTCGGLQPNCPTGTFILSEKSIGFDGLLNFYAGRNDVCDLAFEEAFKKQMNWNPQLCAPYVIDNNKELIDRLYDPTKGMVKGVTIACGGFFGPQGRELRIPLADPEQNSKVESFEYEGHKITNFEMESSAIAGLSALLGHKAVTVCMVIANRVAKVANTGYKNQIDDLIKIVLDKI